MLTLSATGIRENDSCSVQLGATAIEAMTLQRVSPGILAISFQVPEDAPTGNEVPVAISVSGTKSRTGVTVSIDLPAGPFGACHDRGEPIPKPKEDKQEHGCLDYDQLRRLVAKKLTPDSEEKR
jgi:hypothetical protein